MWVIVSVILWVDVLIVNIDFLMCVVRLSMCGMVCLLMIGIVLVCVMVEGLVCSRWWIEVSRGWWDFGVICFIFVFCWFVLWW